ncbi:MAG TPA: DinB family protein [Gemmatimonadaceae bacterium]|nr:DinB family protein [Gemmatimonadaceae bacterium]
MSQLRQLRAVLATTVLFALSSAALQAQSAGQSAPPPGFRGEFLGQFESSMSKFIALAKAMPPDKYTWSPGQGVMSVARVYGHVARYNFYYPADAMGIAAPANIGLDSLEAMTNKAAIVAMLERSNAHVRSAVTAMTDDQLAKSTTLYGRTVSQWAVLFQLLAHMNEHLGQSIAYARSNGVVPPWSQ